MCLVPQGCPMTDQVRHDELDAFAAILNSRLAISARIARAKSFALQCAGWLIALVMTGIGVVIAFWEYSTTISPSSAADVLANAIADAFKRAEIRTIVSGTMKLSPDAELTLAKDQTVKLMEGSIVKLDPSSMVRVVGDLKINVPQP